MTIATMIEHMLSQFKHAQQTPFVQNWAWYDGPDECGFLINGPFNKDQQWLIDLLQDLGKRELLHTIHGIHQRVENMNQIRVEFRGESSSKELSRSIGDLFTAMYVLESRL